MLNMPFTTTGIGMSQLLYRISVECVTLSTMKNITKTEVIFVKFIPLWYITLKLTYILQHVNLNKIIVAVAVVVIIVLVLVVEEVVVVVGVVVAVVVIVAAAAAVVVIIVVVLVVEEVVVVVVVVVAVVLC
jgi:hypothetical protein